MPEARESRPTEIIELPLRGMAAEGADASIRAALQGVPGVLSIDVVSAAFRVRITHDGRPGAREAIDAALHTLGLVSSHAKGDSGAEP